MEFFSDKRFWVVFFITFFIYFIGTVSGALRFAGIKTKLITTSFSLLNVITLISRLSNLIQTPFLGSMVDIAYRDGQLDVLRLKIHFIILASTLGCLVGIFLFTTFEKIFVKWIEVFDRKKGMVSTFVYFFYPRSFFFFLRSISRPLFYLRIDYLRRVPFVVFWSSTLIGAFWTTGVLSAIYASVIVPEFARTATILSGIVNGVATILFTIFLDPVVANITDKVYNGDESLEYLYNVLWVNLIGALLGTILAHFVFYPGAVVIANITIIFSKI
ncbi:MAG: lipid II flippase Amj family protein [bacterium]|nr:lipid II flippase Amj family protein [bacterium]